MDEDSEVIWRNIDKFKKLLSKHFLNVNSVKINTDTLMMEWAAASLFLP